MANMAACSELEAYVRPPPRPILYPLTTISDRKHPEQVHISLVGSKDSHVPSVVHMRVTWITKDSQVPSVVEYGISPGKYSYSARGDAASSYSYLSYVSGYIHHVVIGPLEADTVYYYQCGRHGKEYKLRTPPSQFPVTFAISGDLGQTGWTKSTLQHIQASGHDVFLLPGDLSYADDNQPLWDSFGQLVEPLASSRPWMVTEGNHEIETIPFKSYNARWRMPYEESGSSSNLYYSFEVAGVHVVMLGSYTDFREHSKQYKWLQADLASVNRAITPWLIVLLHAPWYNTNTAHQGEGEKMRQAMEPLLYAANVDIVFAGHVHAYERFARLYNNETNPCGPVYITIGDGGNREGLASEFNEPQPKISLFREASFGHGELRIDNATRARWSWHRNQDDESVIADEVWINSFSGSTDL